MRRRGRVVSYLQGLEGWDEVKAYHVLFLVYALMGCVNVGLVLMLDEKCELDGGKGGECDGGGVYTGATR